MTEIPTLLVVPPSRITLNKTLPPPPPPSGVFRVFRCCMGAGDPGEDTGLMNQHVTYYSRMPHEVSSSELQFNPNAKGS